MHPAMILFGGLCLLGAVALYDSWCDSQRPKTDQQIANRDHVGCVLSTAGVMLVGVLLAAIVIVIALAVVPQL